MKSLVRSWARLVGAAACLLVASAAVPAQPLPGERAVVVKGIDGVVDDGASWELVWADFRTADGLVGTADGGVLFAQEQGDTIRRLDVNNHESVFLSDTHGAGALSMDAQGRLYAVQRTCTDPGRPFSSACQELPRISILAPETRLLANMFADGRPLGRLNDLVADGRGGAYFTVADQDIRTNGLMLSTDGRTLYVTNSTTVVAFDVQPDGSTSHRREFAQLAGDTGADGMAIDAAGRLYVSATSGVHVLSPKGEHLGLIPTPRVPISIAFAGPQKRTLYVAQMGAVGPDGKPWSTPPGVRNTAMTIYRIPMLAEGFKGRPK